jgi:ubiquinone biosynthesis protein
VLTLEWLDGIKLSKRNELIAAGHDPRCWHDLVRAFLRQAVVDGYFTLTCIRETCSHSDGRVAAVDFGIMGRIDRQARLWLAEIPTA